MIFAVFRFIMIHIALTHCYKLEGFFTLIFISVHAMISRSRTLSERQTGAKTEFNAK